MKQGKNRCNPLSLMPFGLVSADVQTRGTIVLNRTFSYQSQRNKNSANYSGLCDTGVTNQTPREGGEHRPMIASQVQRCKEQRLQKPTRGKLTPERSSRQLLLFTRYGILHILLADTLTPSFIPVNHFNGHFTENRRQFAYQPGN